MIKWIVKDIPPKDKVLNLSRAINVRQSLSTLLIQREIKDYATAKSFFRPSLDALHDPFKMKDMDKAVSRILKAFENKEKILVYGDYDVDGTTSVALFYHYLKQHHQFTGYYIPDRYKEGYGISKAGITYAKKEGYQLIVALDCGIKANELIDEANKNGIDFIICDHHRPGNQLPNAIAILDPKRADCPYPYKELSGCGIGFKLIQAISDQLPTSTVEINDYLDLVAVSIAADIVPITGENRILAYYGLILLNNKPRYGLSSLVDEAGIKGEINIMGIVFGIAPRINSAGRMKHAHDAVALLLSESKKEAKEKAAHLNHENSMRKEKDNSTTNEAIEMIGKLEGTSHLQSTVLYKENWHKGVIGIVASRCIEQYYRPTIILTKSNGMATGSARSVDGFDIYNAIESCKDLLDHFGGHKYAAGLTLPVENIEVFRKRFEDVVAKKIRPDQLVPKLEIDLHLSLKEIDFKFYKIIAQMAPFGPGNMSPIFYSDNLKLAGSLKVLKDRHLKFQVTELDEDKNVVNRPLLSCIGFNLADKKPQLIKAKQFKMAYAIELNEFRGEKTIQLNIKDIQFD